MDLIFAQAGTATVQHGSRGCRMLKMDACKEENYKSHGSGRGLLAELELLHGMVRDT